MSAPFEIAVGTERGRVILDIHEAAQGIRTIVHLDPPNAVNISKAMLDAAVNCGARVEIQVPRAQVAEATRDKLISRIALMSSSMIDQKFTPGKMAMEIVDIVLREVA